MKKKTGKRNADKWRTIRIVLIGIFLIALLVGFYYYVANRMEVGKAEEAVNVTRTQRVLSRSLETNYPPSPREVVKYYSEITQCFYNEEYEEEELEKLARQIQKLYADELVAGQTSDEYMSSLKSDIASMKENKCVVSTYSPSASTDVEYYSEDGHDWAKLYCLYSIRQGTAMVTSNEIFLLQKDADGHWKIYGWKLADDRG